MRLSKLGQIALPVTSTDRAEQFYGEMLGLPKLFRYGELVFFDCGGVVAADLQAKGASFEREPHLVAKMPDHELWMAFFRDPDGHLLAVMEEKR